MRSKILQVYKQFRRDNGVSKEHETLVVRAIRSGWDAAQDDNKRHQRVRRSFRGIIERGKLPY